MIERYTLPGALNRRGFMKLAAAAGGAMAVPFAPAYAQAMTLKASIFSPGTNFIVGVVEGIGKDLAEATGGEVQVSIFHSGQMGPPPRQYDLARSGTADIAWVLHGFTPGRFPMTDLASLPDLFESATAGTEGLSRASAPLEAEHAGTKVLGLVASPPLVLMTGSRQVQKMEDIRGMRIRPPSGMIAETIQALGGTSVAVPPMEMSEALSKGIIDGIVTSVEAAVSYNLTESVKHVTNLNMGIASFALLMNPDSYARLPDAARAKVDELAAGEISRRLNQAIEDTEAEGYHVMEAAGVTFIKPDATAAVAYSEAMKANREARVKAVVDGGKPEAAEIYQLLQG